MVSLSARIALSKIIAQKSSERLGFLVLEEGRSSTFERVGSDRERRI